MSVTYPNIFVTLMKRNDKEPRVNVKFLHRHIIYRLTN